MATSGTIGLGAIVEINDGAASAFVPIDGVTNMSVPDPECGVVESKTLDLAGYTLGKVPGLLEPGQVTITYEFTKARKARFDALVRTAKSLKVTLPEGSPAWTKTVPVFIVSNKMDTVEADGIMMATLTIQVTGPAA